MVRVKEVIVVEGRYDLNQLRQTVDATVMTTEGFQIFRDREKQAMLRSLARRRGLVILTDPDGAGSVIRGFLSGIVEPQYLLHAYIPDIYGKEKRKSSPSREGKLGVEGMRPEVLLEALRRAGATFVEETDGDAEPTVPSEDALSDGTGSSGSQPVTKADLYEWGLSGGPDSGEKRRRLLERLSLPTKLNANALLDAVNLLYSREELVEVLRELESSGQ